MHSDFQLPTAITGIIHGKQLHLDRETGLPDGQVVSVVVRPVEPAAAPGEGLRRAFGGWSDDIQGLDEFLTEMRKSRDLKTDGTIQE